MIALFQRFMRGSRCGERECLENHRADFIGFNERPYFFFDITGERCFFFYGPCP